MTGRHVKTTRQEASRKFAFIGLSAGLMGAGLAFGCAILNAPFGGGQLVAFVGFAIACVVSFVASSVLR